MADEETAPKIEFKKRKFKKPLRTRTVDSEGSDNDEEKDANIR